MVYVNTLMLQDVMGDATWADIFTPADRRGLTPLFWIHVMPNGEFKLRHELRLASRSARSTSLKKRTRRGGRHQAGGYTAWRC